MRASHAFTPYLEPRSIAIIGASSDPTKPGYTLVQSIIDGGYEGGIHPVNPRGGEILGRKAYPTIADVPGPVDLAFVLIGNRHVAEAIRACGRSGVRSAAIITAGFGEVPGEGPALDAELRRAIAESGVRCVGPNTIGVVNRHCRLNASFVPLPAWPAGKISLLGQTGTIAGSLADEIMHQPAQRLEIGKIVAIGNKADLDEVDFLEYCRDDPETAVIGLHLESMKRPRPFFSLCQTIKRNKPIVLLKSGRTEVGGRVSASHTGGLTTDDGVFDAACRQYGVVRCYTVADFLATLKALSYQPLPRGRRVGVISYSGGMAVVASDELSAVGLDLPEFADRTREQLSAMLPPWQPAYNPVDLWPAMTGDNLGVQGRSIRIGMDDPATDAILLILLAVPNSACSGLGQYFQEAMAANPHKPIYCVFVGGKVADEWRAELEPRMPGPRVPVFDDTSTAVRALAAAAWYGERRDRLSPDPNSINARADVQARF